MVRYSFLWSQMAESLMLEDPRDFLTVYWTSFWPRVQTYLSTHNAFKDLEQPLLNDHLRLLYFSH